MEEGSAGFFVKSVILGILEAADYLKIDHVSLFFGEIIFSLCGNTEIAPVTEVLISYVNLNNTIRRRFCSSGWTENILKLLDVQSNSFKNILVKVLVSN